MSDENVRTDSFEGRFTRIETRQESLFHEYKQLKEQITGLAKGIDDLKTTLTTNSKPHWGVIGSFVTICLVVLGGMYGLVFNPINDRLTKVEISSYELGQIAIRNEKYIPVIENNQAELIKNREQHQIIATQIENLKVKEELTNSYDEKIDELRFKIHERDIKTLKEWLTITNHRVWNLSIDPIGEIKVDLEKKIKEKIEESELDE